jgi:hypothetical protein
MILGPPELPARCTACGYELPFREIPRDDYRALLDDHYVRIFMEELRMLEMVDDFRSRRGHEAANIVPHFRRVLDSDDPDVRRQLHEGVPFAEIRLPPDPAPRLTHPDDREVIDSLRHNSFELVGRFKYVRQRLGELRATVRAVACPRCAEGSLRLVK